MKTALACLLCALWALVGCNPAPSEPSDGPVADALAQVSAAASAAADSHGPSPDDLPFTRKRRAASGFVPANPDTRTPLQWAQAACQAATWSPDDPTKGWRCGTKVPRATTFASGGPSTPIIPSSWTVPNWFVNKSTGNDGNSCTSSGSPCATKQEIVVHRWGCGPGSLGGQCPRFRTNVVLEQDAADTDNTDPFYIHNANENGAGFTIQGNPNMTCTAAVFTRTAQKNRALGSNSLLKGSFSAGSPAPGSVIVNTTRANSKAIIYKSDGGSNWQLSQPMAPVTIPLSTFVPAENDTWASTDNVQVCTPTAIDIVAMDGWIADLNGGFNNLDVIYRATLFDPGGVATNTVYLGANTYVVESVAQRVAGWLSDNVSFARASLNSAWLAPSFNSGAGEYNDPVYEGGYLFSNAFGGIFTGTVLFDGDVIVGGGAGNNATTVGFNYGFAYLDSSTTAKSGTSTALIANYGGSVIYGAAGAGIVLQGNSHFANLTGNSFASTFTAPGIVAGFALNSATTGTCATGADPQVLHNATATPAHLDTGCDAGGLGGAAYNWAGASVANF